MRKIIDEIFRFFSDLSPAISSEAREINGLFGQFMVLSGVVVLLIGGLIIISVIRFRAKGSTAEPPQVFGNRNLEIAWTVLPFLAVTFFFILTVRVMKAIDLPAGAEIQPDITIVAHQWWWEMKYPKENIKTANELHIPAGKKLLVHLESSDVIHDWWVPAMGRKMDAIPGHDNYFNIEADSAGEYKGTCSEYCGMQHAWMRILVIAQPEEEYNKWLQQQKTKNMPTDREGSLGAYLFQKKACSNCHTVYGNAAAIGPDLSHLASRKTLLAGMITNTRENLTLWLKNPQTVKPGAHMPNFKLNEDELKAMVTYLEELK